MSGPPPSDHISRISFLRTLLHLLPARLPCPGFEETEYGQLAGFALEEGHVQRYGGDIPKAVVWQLQTIFHDEEENIQINERGGIIECVADVLARYMDEYPNDLRLKSFLESLITALTNLLTDECIEFPTDEQSLCGSESKQAASISTKATSSSKKPGTTVKAKQDALSQLKPDDQPEIAGRKILNELIRLPSSKEAGTKGAPKLGAPGDAAIAEFAVKYKHKRTQKSYYACIGVDKGCCFIRSGNASKDRVLGHIAYCSHLSADQRIKADSYAAGNALGSLLKKDAPECVTSGGRKREGSISIQESVPPLKKSKGHVLKPGTKFEINVTEAGAKQLTDETNFAILKFITVHGIPPTVLDSDEWKELTTKLNHRYKHTPASQFTEKLIPAEAAHVRKQTLKLLREQTNLTLTFDGNSTRGADSVYLIHFTTPDERDSYLLAGIKGSDEHHDQHWIQRKLLENIEKVGADRTCTVCSDSTGNTKAGRRNTRNSLPILLDLGDCCHHIQLTINDINRIPEMKEFISLLKKAIKFFTTSNFSSAQLKKARADAGVTQGLVKIGKTRFVTHWSASVALEKNLELIKQLVTEGHISPKDKDVADIFKNPTRFSTFQLKLLVYIQIVEPLGRSLWSLESPHTNAADVYIFWLAIASNLRRLFMEPTANTGISSELASKVTSIVTKRYKAFIDDSPTDIYFCAFFLHPLYVRSDILRRPSTVGPTITLPACKKPKEFPPDAAKTAASNVPYPAAYERAKKFLKQVLRDEVEYTEKIPESTPRASPIGLIIQRLGAAKVVQRFQVQLLAYARGDYPFDSPLDDSTKALDWWKLLLPHEHGNILAALAVKLFSALVNSMPDERTGSRLTWLNSPVRGRQNVETLINMIQIGQWYGIHQKEDSAKPRRHPKVSFIDINKEMDNAKPVTIEKALESDSEPESELDQDDADALIDQLPVVDNDTIPGEFGLDDAVDIDAPFLSGFLSGAKAAVPRGSHSTQPELAVCAKSSEDLWNF